MPVGGMNVGAAPAGLGAAPVGVGGGSYMQSQMGSYGRGRGN